MRGSLAIFKSFFFKPSSPFPLALLRILCGLYVLSSAERYFYDYYLLIQSGDFEPFGYFKLILSEPLSLETLNLFYYALLASTVLFTVGLFTRFSIGISIICSIFVVAYPYNFGKINNNQNLLWMTILLLLFSRCHDVWSVDAWIAKKKSVGKHWKYQWPISLVKAQVVLAMFTLGYQKLYFAGLDWAFSDGFYIDVLKNAGGTSLQYWLLAQPSWVSQALATYALFVVELLAPLALFNPFAKIYPLIWGTFHVGVSSLFGGHQGFYSQFIPYLFFYDVEGWIERLRRLAGKKP